MIDLDLFHFMRPLWLAAIPVTAAVWWLARRREKRTSGGTTLLAPHLQEALTVDRHARRAIRPIDGVGVALVAVAVAAAGPTWSRQPSPWFSETAPLVVAIEVSDSMRSNDLQPTRLDRARFEVLDLIERRTGSRTALIAYAGSAHIVMPPSTDVEVVKPFLESLDPAIMPTAGSNASLALPLAHDMLAGDAATAAVGTLLFVNDGFSSTDVPVLAEYASREDSAAVIALVVGTDAGGVALLPDGSAVRDPGGGRLDTAIDASVLRRVENEAGVGVVRATVGDGDIRQLLRGIESNLRLADDPDAAWRDQAWWFVWPAALLTLAWFRRGWTMQW